MGSELRPEEGRGGGKVQIEKKENRRTFGGLNELCLEVGTFYVARY